MRRECVSRKSGAPRARAAGIAANQPLVRPSGPESASNSTGTVCVAGPLSGSFVWGEAASSLSRAVTPQHCPAAAADLAWLQRVEQHQSARTVCVLRAGAPYATWAPNATSTTSAHEKIRFTDNNPLDDAFDAGIQPVGASSFCSVAELRKAQAVLESCLREEAAGGSLLAQHVESIHPG
jgi:hypothetical protein